MVCVGALWWFETATGLITELDSRGYPFLLAIFGTALTANLFLRNHQRTVELICYLGLAFYFVVSLFTFVAVPNGIYTVANTLQWMPLIYVAAFVFFAPRQALLVAGGAYLCSLIPPLVLVAVKGHGVFGLEVGALLVNAYVVHLLALLSLSLVALLHGRFQEVTELARDLRTNREELRAALDLNRTTLENMDQGLLMFDANERLQVYNKRALELLDLPRDLLARRPLYDELVQYQIAHGEFAHDEAFLYSVPTTKLSESPPLYERIRPDGRIIEVRTVFLGSGGAVRTITDRTARRKAEAQLRESETRYRLLAENTADMIILTGLDRKRLYVSPASRELLGYEPEELLGIRSGDLIHPEDQPSAVGDLQDLLDGRGRASTVTYRARHKAGHWVTVEARRRLLLNDHGQPQGLVSVIRDTSERAALEERLRQAQKMEAVGQLTGGVAHDFNNLLTVVIGNSEMLVEELADPHQRSLATGALEAAERGAHLTQQLLTFGRRQSLRPKRLALREVVEGMLPLLRRTIGEHIDLKAEFHAGSRAAFVDRMLLESAILNLVLNARDAMPRGGTLTLSTGERLAGPDAGTLSETEPAVFVTVSDTGTGMPPEVLARVFEPFFTTKEVGKGSGLGLSMVYGFAQQSGGHVAIASEPGRGTSVTILLRAAVRGTADPEAAPGIDLSAARGRERILVVEDEPQVLHFVSAQLTSLGYDVTAVSAGDEALELIETDPTFDLLLTDVVLPRGISGVEVAKRARAIRPELKVLLTSGYPEEVFAQHGRPDEGTPLLPKPYRRKELAAALRGLLQGRDAPSLEEA
jgi:PAS domain S-box-containing protein